MTKLDSVERLKFEMEQRMLGAVCSAIGFNPQLVADSEKNLLHIFRAALTEMWDLSRREALREAAKLARSLFDAHMRDGCECSGLEDLAEDLERLAVEEGTK